MINKIVLPLIVRIMLFALLSIVPNATFAAIADDDIFDDMHPLEGIYSPEPTSEQFSLQAPLDLYFSGNSGTSAIKANGTQVIIETRRGKPTSKAMRKSDPTTPLYEIDVRLLDQNRVPFFTQFGGHSPIDSTWDSPFEESYTTMEGLSPNHDNDISKYLGGAKKIIESLNGISNSSIIANGSRATPEYDAIKNILPLIEEAITVTKIENSDTQSFMQASASKNSHVVEIWKKGAFSPGNILGEHSGTVAKAISSNGYTYQIWSACNHGACPGSKGMRKSCTKTFLNRAGFCQAPPMCSTPYQFDQKDFLNDDHRHVCNDDTYIQYYRIKYNSAPSTAGGTCSDNSLRRYAPSCF